MTTTTDQTPVEIDTALAAAYKREGDAEHAADMAYHGLHTALDRRAGRGNLRWFRTDAEVLAMARTKVAEQGFGYAAVAAILDRLAAAETAITAARDDMTALEAVFVARGGWRRAWLVQGGHVHNTRGCHTLYATTRLFWLVELAAHDEAEIVELAGDRACTVCYPTAPVETLNRPTRLFTDDERKAAAEREAAAAIRAERAAKKAAAAIANPDGTPLRFDGWVVKTVRAAQTEYVSSAAMAASTYYGASSNTPDRVAGRERLLTALAHKRGTTVEDQRTALAGKVAAKLRRDFA